MKILLAFVILNIFTIKLITCQIHCNSQALKKADSNVAKILTLGQTGRKFPENNIQVIKYCDQTFKLINSVENYGKTCLKNMPKQVSSVLFYQVKNQVQQLCKKNSKRRQNLIGVAPCANKANHEFNKCNTIFIDKLLGISNAENKKKIPFICCEYQKIFSCIEERGKKYCNNNEIEEAKNLIRSMTGGVLGSLCTDYRDDSDKCLQLGVIPEKRRNQRRSKSFYIPLIEVVKSFDTNLSLD